MKMENAQNKTKHQKTQNKNHINKYPRRVSYSIAQSAGISYQFTMVQMTRSKGNAGKKVTPLHIFLTIFLCGVSFYTGTLSDKCHANGKTGEVNERNIDAIVQERLQAGKLTNHPCYMFHRDLRIFRLLMDSFTSHQSRTFESRHFCKISIEINTRFITLLPRYNIKIYEWCHKSI
jgi:hypothetical protein